MTNNRLDEVSKTLMHIAATLIPLSFGITAFMIKGKRLLGEPGKYLIPVFLLIINLLFGYCIYLGIKVLDTPNPTQKRTHFGYLKGIFMFDLLLFFIIAFAMTMSYSLSI